MMWHIHRWKLVDSTEEVVRTWPNGARKVRTTCYDECVVCGKRRRFKFRFSAYYRQGEMTMDEKHRETMARLKDLDVKLGSELAETKKWVEKLEEIAEVE